MQETFSEQAGAAMRQAIREAGGNEVFFLGRTDHERRVVEVEVLARGSASAVPAILQACRYGDVVIHNHPSGQLVPSAADLEIAGRLGALGVGFHIVDNPVDNVYRVVEAFRPESRQPVDPARLAGILGPGGEVARSLAGYEERPEQLRMAFAVGEAFNGDRLALIEAGTGTGKSLAYLAPALLWSLENGERVVVSTNTINLQEQLIRKDLPLLQRATGLEVRAVLVKGRGNYLCRRRLATAHQEPELFDEDGQRGELDALVDWAARSRDGCREELTFVPRQALWEEVCCEADQCARVRCADYGACFFHRARRLAAQADVLVVNHALLLADLALRQQTDNYTAAAVLPPFDRIILDEAHHLEDVATSFFSSRVTRFSYARVLGKLRHPRKPDRGLLPRLLVQLGQQLPDNADDLYRDLHARIEEFAAGLQALRLGSAADLERLAERLGAAAGGLPDQTELRRRVDEAFARRPEWPEAVKEIRDLAAATADQARAGRELLKACEGLPEKVAERLASVLTDLAGCVLRLEGIAGDLGFFTAAGPGTCAWFEIAPSRPDRGGGPVLRLCTAPLEVAESLRQALYDRFRTVVLTSATLAVGESFAYVKERVGLDRCPPQRLTELRLASPFDFGRQALLGIPTDLPEPGRAGYPEAVRDLAEQAILAAGGRSFVLFTAYSLLRRVHGELAPVLGARGHRCLRQGEETRHRLLKTFAADPASVLFATDSFWEGVDVPGRALEQVIIARLPFRVPTEPVLEARAEDIERRGGDPFMSYTVPQAVIRFKQGFGRLIRHRADRGVVLILDVRVVKKGYGRVFLRSLPELETVAAPAAEVLRRVAAFFDSPHESAAPARMTVGPE